MQEESTLHNAAEKNKTRKHSNFNTESDPVLFFHLLQKNILWFILIISISITGVVLFLRYTTPIYEANLSFQVGSENTANQLLGVGNFQQQNSYAKDIEVLKSRLLFKRALQRIPLHISYYNQGKILNNELYKTSPINVDFSIKDSTILGTPFYIKTINDTYFELYQNETLLGEYQANKTISLPKVDLTINIIGETSNSLKKITSSNLFFILNDISTLTNNYIGNLSIVSINASAKTIKISFKDNNPLKARDIVTAVAEEYIAYDIEERSKSSRKSLGFIDEQLDQYYNKVKGSEKKIEDFQSENNYKGFDLSTVYFDRTNKLENELINIDLQRSVLIEIKKSINTDTNQDDLKNLLPILSGTDYSTKMSSLIQQLKDLLIKKDNLGFKVTDDSEIAQTIDHQIEVQRNFLFESINSLIKNLELQRKEVTSKIDEIESKYLNIPAKELQYARLQRVLSIDEKFFTMLTEKRTEYSISDAGFVSQHTILVEALTPTSPIFPNEKLFYAFGVLLGFVLSLILLVVKFILKNTISSIDEILRQSHSNIGVLGIVPKYTKDIPISQLVVNKNPKSIIAEAFRAIRSNLQFISNFDGKKVMAVTSTISGEGKTFVAINTAGIIAYSGKKVIILDLDMRKPKIHLGFGVENTIGMSTLLINKAKYQDCVHHSELENLDFITSGPVPPTPSELLIIGEGEKLVEDLTNFYDFIIIDNPPIGLVSDAMQMLQKADYPVYVFKNEYSKKYFVNNVDKLILDNGIKNLTIVLNAVETGKSGYGYGYGYGYGGGYGYGYGGYYEDEPKEKNGILSKIIKNK
jgi:capsular exopolysaccharide synthesis family protein